MNITKESFQKNILLVTVILGLLGVINIYSAGRNTPMASAWMKQLLWLGLGFALAFRLKKMDAHKLFEWSVPLYILSVLLLALVLGVGQNIGGSTRWFSLGPLGLLQPSEFAKWSTLLIASHLLGNYLPQRTPRFIFVALSVLIGIPFLLIFFQPDLGMAISYVPIFVLIPLARTIKTRTLIIGILLISVAGVWGWSQGLRPYQKDRIVQFLNPSKDLRGRGYQINQSRIAIGNGGIFGRGIGGGSQTQLNFIPVKTSDFVFSVWAEEHGYLGVVIIFLITGLIFSQILTAGVTAATLQEAYFCIGAACIWCLHFMVNVAMVIGALPNKGMVLPFFSYGGSSTIAFCLMLGLVANIQYRGRHKS